MIRFLKKLFKLVFSLVLAAIIVVVLVFAVPNLWEVGTSSLRMMSAEDAAIQADEGTTYDAILVLGAAVNPDGTPSTILRDRLDVAVRLYFDGVAPVIIMSGDNREATYNECYNMKTYAISQGVPSEDIFCDHRGVCTYDSMYRAKTVFGVERMMVVTQTYHLYRAVFDANGLGIDAYGVPSDVHQYQDQDYYDRREALARINDFKKVVLRETSEYLSEPVSLDQSGDVTYW